MRRDFAAELDVIDASLRAGGSALLADGRLRMLRKAIAGVRLPPRDRGPAPELRRARSRGGRIAARSGRGAGLSRALRGGSAQRVLLAELASPRALRSAFATYSELTAGELAIFEAAAAVHRRLGPEAIRQYVISKTDSVSDLLEVAVLLKEVGFVDPGRGAVLAPADRAALRDHRGPAAAPRRPCAAGSRSRHGALDGALARRHPGSDARLLRQQQGWRLHHVQLGALQGGDRAGGRVPRGRRAAALLPRARRHRRTRRRTELRCDPRAAARAACRASCD